MTWPRTASVLLLLLLGMLCKETFLVAAATLLVAHALVEDGRMRFDQRFAPFLVVYVLAAWIFVVLRTSLMPHGTKAAGIPLAALGNELRIVAIGAKTLLVPFPRPMRLLAWEVSRPWSIGDALALLLVVGTLVALAARRRVNAPVLVAGAVATLLPASLVSGGFWLGFDRYLYMPGCLIVLAIPLSPIVARTSVAHASVARIVGGSLLVAGLLAATALTGKTYASQRAFYRTMIAARPLDPTGYIVGINSASVAGDLAEAQELVAAMPTHDLPPVLLHRAILAELAMNRIDEAARLVEDASRRFPGDSRFVLDVLRVRGEQNRWDDVVAETELVLREHPQRRAAARTALRRWLSTGRVPPERRAQLLELSRRASDGAIDSPRD